MLFVFYCCETLWTRTQPVQTDSCSALSQFFLCTVAKRSLVGEMLHIRMKINESIEYCSDLVRLETVICCCESAPSRTTIGGVYFQLILRVEVGLDCSHRSPCRSCQLRRSCHSHNQNMFTQRSRSEILELSIKDSLFRLV